MIEYTIHDQAHPTLVHLRDQQVKVLHRAQERIERTVIHGIIAVIGGGIHDWIHIDSRDAELLQVVQLLRDTGQVAAKEVIALPLIAISCRRLAEVGRQVIPGTMLHGLMSAGLRAGVVIALVAIEETIREDLIDDRFLGPVRRMIVRTVDRELEQLGSTQRHCTGMTRFRIVTVFLHAIQEELIAIDAIRIRPDRDAPGVQPVLRPFQLHRPGLTGPRLIARIVLIPAIGRDLRLIQHELRLLDIAMLRLKCKPYRRTDPDRFKRAAEIRIPGVVQQLILMDAAIIRHQFLCRRVIVERHVAIPGNRHICLYSRLPFLGHGELIGPGLDRQRRLIELIHQHILHDMIALDRSQIAAKHRQLILLQQLVVRAVLDLVRLIVVVERDFGWFVQIHLDVRPIRVAIEAIVFRPAAVDRDLVVVGPGRQIRRIRIEAVSGILHTCFCIARIPVLGRADLRLDRSGHDERTLGQALLDGLLLCLHAIIGKGRLMGCRIVCEGDFMCLGQPQFDILAVGCTSRTIVCVPAAAHGNLELIVAGRYRALELILAVADGFHGRRAIRRIPVFSCTELRLQTADEHDILRTDSSAGLSMRDKYGQLRQCHRKRSGQQPYGKCRTDGTG